MMEWKERNWKKILFFKTADGHAFFYDSLFFYRFSLLNYTATQNMSLSTAGYLFNTCNNDFDLQIMLNEEHQLTEPQVCRKLVKVIVNSYFNVTLY